MNEEKKTTKGGNVLSKAQLKVQLRKAASMLAQKTQKENREAQKVIYELRKKRFAI